MHKNKVVILDSLKLIIAKLKAKTVEKPSIV